MAINASKSIGSKTPITHALSWCILSVIGRRRHITDLPNLCNLVVESKDDRPTPVEGPAEFIAAYRPWVSEGACFGGHMAAPHHLSGPPPPAMAMLEIGATVAVPIVSAAAARTIASDVFMLALLSDRQ